MDDKAVQELTTDATVAWFKSKGDGGDVKSLAVKIAMAVAVLAFVSYFSYTAWRRNKELAKTKHELDVLKEEATRHKLDDEFEKDEQILNRKNKKLEKLKEEALQMKADLDSLREKHQYEEFKIEAIKNWDDMDRYFAELRSRDLDGEGGQ